MLQQAICYKQICSPSKTVTTGHHGWSLVLFMGVDNTHPTYRVLGLLVTPQDGLHRGSA